MAKETTGPDSGRNLTIAQLMYADTWENLREKVNSKQNLTLTDLRILISSALMVGSLAARSGQTDIAEANEVFTFDLLQRVGTLNTQPQKNAVILWLDHIEGIHRNTIGHITHVAVNHPEALNESLLQQRILARRRIKVIEKAYEPLTDPNFKL